MAQKKHQKEAKDRIGQQQNAAKNQSNTRNPKTTNKSASPLKIETSSPSPKSTSSGQSTTTPNQPRNHLIRDATSPFTFTFQRFGETQRIVIRQSVADDTWPGGALWDIGVLLARVLVLIDTNTNVNTHTKPQSSSSSSSSSSSKIDHLRLVARLKPPGVWPTSWKNTTVLELGCGVGLTGLVAASLGAKLTVLTDLDIVVDKVTRPNLELNSSSFRSGQKVFAMPLCWGNEEDEHNCSQQFAQSMKGSSKPMGRRRNKKKSTRGDVAPHPSATTDTSAKSNVATPPSPDVVIIGDVAYQHKPGHPSHFHALLSTLLKFTTSAETVVIFGTRMRMPASHDLLMMIREHFDEVVDPPVEAHEIDGAFHCDNLGKKSMITVHIFKRKC